MAGGSLPFVRSPTLLARLAGRWAVYRDGGAWQGTAGVVLQQGAYDCGPAALANALRIVGYGAFPPERLAELSGTTLRGTSLEALDVTARTLGARTLLAHTPRHQPRPLAMPAVAWLDGSHFVVLVASDARGVTVVDPQVGRYWLPNAAWRRRWYGEALVLLPPTRRPK